MKTTRLVRHTMLRRRIPLRFRSAKRRRSERERDTDFMALVRKLPCVCRAIAPTSNRPTPCSGEVQADHAGARPLGRKADDTTCIPLCRRHHTERTDHRGMFWAMTRDEGRAWRELAIKHTREQVLDLLGEGSEAAARLLLKLEAA